MLRLVSNAGIAIEIDSLSESAAGQAVHLTPVSVYDKTMRVNARGSFLGCKYAIAQMMKQDLHASGDRGWIINLSSVAGLVGLDGCRMLPLLFCFISITDHRQLPIAQAKVPFLNSPNKRQLSMDSQDRRQCHPSWR
jgi:NAD(P)-dependent dehydrogenase (short-subunit alcohol dehydrogenase family)